MKHLVRTSKNLGHAIRQARKAKNLTQKELAAMSGVWQETISKIENGSGGTKLETVFDLVAALDLEITVTERSNQIEYRFQLGNGIRFGCGLGPRNHGDRAQQRHIRRARGHLLTWAASAATHR